MTWVLGYDQWMEYYRRWYRTVGGLFSGEVPTNADTGSAEYGEAVIARIERYMADHPEILDRVVVVAEVQRTFRTGELPALPERPTPEGGEEDDDA